MQTVRVLNVEIPKLKPSTCRSIVGMQSIRHMTAETEYIVLDGWLALARYVTHGPTLRLHSIHPSGWLRRQKWSYKSVALIIYICVWNRAKDMLQWQLGVCDTYNSRRKKNRGKRTDLISSLKICCRTTFVSMSVCVCENWCMPAAASAYSKWRWVCVVVVPRTTAKQPILAHWYHDIPTRLIKMWR